MYYEDEELDSIANWLLKALIDEPKLLWSIGNEDTEIRIESQDEDSLFDFSIYSDRERMPIDDYLETHPLGDILAGENPEMRPIRVCIYEGGIVIVEYWRSETLEDEGIDEVMLIDHYTGKPEITVVVSGKNQPSHQYLIGYNEDDDPFVISYYADGTEESTLVFESLGKYSQMIY